MGEVLKLSRFRPNKALISETPILSYSKKLKRKVDISNWSLYDVNVYECEIPAIVNLTTKQKKAVYHRNKSAFLLNPTPVVDDGYYAGTKSEKIGSIERVKMTAAMIVKIYMTRLEADDVNPGLPRNTPSNFKIGIRPGQKEYILTPLKPPTPVPKWMSCQDRVRFYGGQLTRRYYKLPEEVETTEQYTKAISHIVRKELEGYNNRNDGIKRVFILRSTFAGNSSDLRFTIGTVRTVDDIYDLKVPSNLKSWIEAQGSDPKNAGLDIYALNVRLFFIDVVRPEHSGGTSGNTSQGKTRSSRCSIRKFPWGKVKDYHSKDNGCFHKILAVFLELKDYRRVVKDAVTANIHKQKEPLTYKQCREVAKLICPDLSVNFYGTDGKSLCIENNTASKVLNILFDQGHYQHIIDFIEKPEEPMKPEKTIAGSDEIIYFDFETIYDPETEYVKPYMIAWTNSTGTSRGVLTDPTPVDSSLFHNFFNILLGLRMEKIVLVAYNGSKFDNYLIMSYVSKLDSCLVTTISQNSKLNRSSFILGNTKFSVWDPCQFIAKSLKEATEAFGLKLSKGSVDHSEIQETFEQKGVVPITKSLEEYCQTDVDVLKELCEKIFEIFPVKDIMRCANIVQYSWRVFKDSHFKNTQEKWLTGLDRMDYKSRKIYLANTSSNTEARNPSSNYLTFEQDKFVRNSIYGGRCGGRSTDSGMNLAMIDVVSLYPSVMSSQDFPYGDAEWVDDFEDFNDLLNDYTKEDIDEKTIIRRSFGFVEVKLLQKKNEYGHGFLPQRNEQGRLINDYEGEVHIIVPYFILRYLYQRRDLFSDIEIIKVLHFKNKGYPVFKDFIDKFYSLKREQDMLKGTDNYNPAKREMFKLMLNSVSGKPTEHLYTNVKRMLTKTEPISAKLTELCTQVKPHTSSRDGTDEEITLKSFILGIRPNVKSIPIDFTVYPINARSLQVEEKHEAQGIFMEKKSPPPSHLGSCIYWYARLKMWEDVFSKTRCYYTDTDSAVVDAKFISNLKIGKDLGQWDVELDDIVKVTTPQPKVYALYRSKGEPKTRFKGVSKEKDILLIDGKETTSMTEFIEALEAKRKCSANILQFRGSHKSSLALDAMKITKEFKIKE